MVRRVCVLVGVLAISTTGVLGQSAASIRGVWRVIEVTTGSATTPAQPGLFIFTDRHYSILRDTAREVRPTVADPANVTPAEALAIFGPLQAQSGTYHLAGTNLTVTPIVAKVPPANGNYGASNSWSVKQHADTLWLTPNDGLRERLTGARSTAPAVSTIKLVRVE